jgi:flavin reductase (DIM6/NTAB) family NADH-FMN oxidoreductase RutF
MFYDAVKNNHGFAVDPLKAIVAPRPIAWISSLSADGVANLAPYSFFNIFSEDPSYVAFGSGGVKDSMRNIQATEEFALNLVTHDLREAMNASSEHVGPHVDEFAIAGLNKAPCQFIKAPRVAESPTCLECRLFKIVELPDDEGRANRFMVIGRVLGVHIDDRFIENGRVNTAAMRPLGRLGYSEYATVTEAWRMRRPD